MTTVDLGLADYVRLAVREADRERLGVALGAIERVPPDGFDGEDIERLEAVLARARKEW